jgi:hypothetical protein
MAQEIHPKNERRIHQSRGTVEMQVYIKTLEAVVLGASGAWLMSIDLLVGD